MRTLTRSYSRSKAADDVRYSQKEGEDGVFSMQGMSLRKTSKMQAIAMGLSHANAIVNLPDAVQKPRKRNE